jgi:hypothetical protein
MPKKLHLSTFQIGTPAKPEQGLRIGVYPDESLCHRSHLYRIIQQHAAGA